jgi:hypothetical protein
MTDDLVAHLIELELRLQTPTIRKDADATGELLSQDFREFGASGRVWDRTAILAELSAETPYSTVSTDFQCQRLSSDLALLTYVASTSTRRTLRSSIWRLEQGRWRLIFHQGTVIPGTV